MSVDVNKCIAFSVTKGKAVSKKELAAKLWPESHQKTRMLNMSNLISGKTERINPEWVQTICDECGVDPNYLFNFKPMTDE